ncbi:hypothetical protein N9B31_08060 [Mariniblastus sp.]|nr:hypothetical protein [bacterium]MDA7901657.1 hypothetical protein [bacterium]MDA7903602.1 hypothetical protein [Mariniblastus sp.]MDA7911769.1 hypothetical protein [bacterium]
MSQTDQPEDVFETTEVSQPPRKRRWKWLFLSVIAIILIFPNLLGWIGLQQTAIDFVFKDFKGKISVEQAAFGWIQPIELHGVTAIDEEGNLLFTTMEITSSKPLYSFLFSDDMGMFEVREPTVHLKLRPDGSNLEEALSQYLTVSEKSKSTQPKDSSEIAQTSLNSKLFLNIIDGQVIISTTYSNEAWQVDDLNIITQLNCETAPLVIDAKCQITPFELDSQGAPKMLSPGALAFSSQVDAGQKALTFDSIDFLLNTRTLPLSVTSPILERIFGPTATAGTLSGKIEATYTSSKQSLNVTVQQIDIRDFGFASPNLIGTDQLAANNITAQGGLLLSPSTVAGQQFKIQSDFGTIRANGTLSIQQLNQLTQTGQLPSEPFELDGTIDLAKSIQMLRSTLKLHDDLIVNSGTLTFQAGSQIEKNVKRMVVNMDAANLNAIRGTRAFTWAKPLRVVGTIEESKNGLAINNILCTTDFLTLRGNADTKTGDFTANGDLGNLTQRLEQFIDLKGWKFAGTLAGKFGWQFEPPPVQTAGAAESNSILVKGDFNITQPTISGPDMPLWQHSALDITASTALQPHSVKSIGLDRTNIELRSGKETFAIELAEPCKDLFQQNVWKANCQITGPVANWLAELNAFVDLRDVQASGELGITCNATVDSEKIELNNIDYHIDDLFFNGFGLKLNEPRTVGNALLVYQMATGDIEIETATVSNNSVIAESKDIRISFPGYLQVEGSVGFRGDVNRISHCLELSPTNESIFWYGGLEGTAILGSNENGIGCRINSTISDLSLHRQVDVVINQAQTLSNGQTLQAGQVIRQWKEIWLDSKVDLMGDISLATNFDAIGFQKVKLESASLYATLDGSIHDLGKTMQADLRGTWKPGWEKINQALQSNFGGLFELSGNQLDQYVIQGPVFEPVNTTSGQASQLSPDLQATANLNWNSGKLLGVPVGASKLDFLLQQKIADLRTDGIPFAGGSIQLNPKIDLRGEEPMIRMTPTRVIDNVALDAETAHQWLSYIAPMMADSTSAEGSFTVDIGSAAIPAFDPLGMELSGTIHLSDLQVGASPMTRQLIGTIKQLRNLMKPNSAAANANDLIRMSPQSVPFVVKDERIYHETMTIQHKDLVFQTKGSVGFDQTLDMIAEIQIADDWIEGKPLLAGLRGRSISIPVRGTVSKPLLDKNVIKNFSQNLVNKATGGLLNEKIQQERDKLFGKIGEELGIPTANQPGLNNGTNSSTNFDPNQLEEKIQGELIKGIGNLFGK